MSTPNPPGGNPPNPFDAPTATSAPPQKPTKNIEIAPIERLKRAKAMMGEQYWLFFGITFVGIILGSLVPLGILMGPMMCGIFLCYRQRMLGQPTSFDPLFKGFDYFAESLIAFLIYMGITFLLMIPIMIIYFAAFMGIMVGAEANDSPETMLLFIPMYLIFYAAIFAVSAAVYTPFTFVFPLIVDRGMKGVEAVKTSWATAKPIFFKLFMMYFIFSIIGLFLACLCVIPAYLFLPISIGAVFTLYEDFFGFNNQNPLATAQ